MRLTIGCILIAARALGADISLSDLIDFNEKDQPNHYLVFGRSLICKRTRIFHEKNKIEGLDKLLQLSTDSPNVIAGHILGVGTHFSLTQLLIFTLK